MLKTTYIDDMKQIGLYVHIPFCKQKCYYCDFCSYANKENLIDEYMKCLNCEISNATKIKRLDDEVIIKSIYIGGGTPSFIKSKYILEIMKNIQLNYNIEKNAEITIEVNPGTIDIYKLEDYINSGINRLSIGLQSTYDGILREIGRIHNYKEFLETYYLARQVGFLNINVDLMLGLPNQTLQEIENSLEEVIGLNPEHISVYSLIIEEGTKLEKLINEGKLKLPNEETEREMYWKVKEILEANNYKHYEISNFSKEGFASKHNQDCWNQKEYIGFGVGAHSYTNGIRYSNLSNIEKYIQNYKNEKSENNFIFHENQNQEDKKKEFMMLGLRKIEGVTIQEFKNKFNENPIYIFHNELEKLSNQELIEIDGDNIKLTNKGLDFANIVWEEFV